MPKVHEDPLDAVIRKQAQLGKPRSKPLWDGPCALTKNGGVTVSMISKFLIDPERFRLRYMEGLRSSRVWEHKSGYGDMFHLCEEHHAAGKDYKAPLEAHCKELLKDNQFRGEEIEKYKQLCLLQFPLYVEHWKKHRDVKKRTHVFSEKEFCVQVETKPYPRGYPYEQYDFTKVVLRGKLDSVDKEGDTYTIQENKTKGNPKVVELERQMNFDLQTMTYAVVIQSMFPKAKIAVRYSVIKRPLSGGEGSISQRQPTQGSKCNLKSCKENPTPDCGKCGGTGRFGEKRGETDKEFSARLAEVIKTKPHFWRWKVTLTQNDIDRFKNEFLLPTLTRMCNWYDCITQEGLQATYAKGLHWRHPFGVWNPLDNDSPTEYDEMIQNQSLVGLERIDVVSPELTLDPKKVLT